MLIACAAGGAVARRPPRRGLAVLAATAFALAALPTALPVLGNRALARADRLSEAGRIDEARVEADLAASLDRTSVDAQLERASLLQSLGRPRDARRAVDHALELAPKDSGTWLTLAGYQRYCWHDSGWRASLARARALAGHDTVFDGTDEDVIAASDACPRTRARAGAQVPRMTISFAPLASAAVMPSRGVTNCTLPTSFASLRAAGP